MGGQTGLFIGMSVLTTVELLELLIRLIQAMYRHFTDERISTRRSKRQIVPYEPTPVAPAETHRDRLYIIRPNGVEFMEKVNFL